LRRVARLRGTSVDPPQFDVDDALGRHRGRIVEFVERFKLRTVAFTQRSTNELFSLASNRRRPFRESGKAVTDAGFKDAVIYLSVVDDLRSTRAPAALISSDSDYVGADGLLDREMALPLASVEEMVAALKLRLEGRTREEADARRQIADSNLRASNKHMKALQVFIRKEFRLPELIDRVPGFGRIREITALEAIRVEVRNLVPSTHDVKPTEQVRLTTFALLRLDVVAEKTEFVRPAERRPGVGVGEKPQPPWGTFGQSITSVSQHTVHVFTVVEMTARRTSEGYDNFEPDKLHVPTGMVSATKELKYEGDRWIAELRSRGDITDLNQLRA
jgi:hypothetical protein